MRMVRCTELRGLLPVASSAAAAAAAAAADDDDDDDDVLGPAGSPWLLLLTVAKL
jgi:hypothetical protein